MKRLFYLLAAAAFTACGSATTLSVMTFNMRYDNPEDGADNWRFRRGRVAEVIASHGVDVFGTQELLANQLGDLKRLLPGYAAVGVGREDGACERVATWVVLHDREGGREFLFVNTHLDHVGQVARDEGVNLLRERIEALRGDRPVILTGDFNSEPGSSVVAHVQKDGVLHDVKQVAARKSGTEWSFSDFGQILEAERPLLDYIFVSDGIAADLYEVLPDTLGGGYVSDHAPVMAIVKFEK